MIRFYKDYMMNTITYSQSTTYAFKAGALAVALCLLSACTGTKFVSQNVSDTGNVAPSDVIFPKIDDAWQKEGTFPSNDSLAKIRAGMNKDQLRALIGTPHFSEGYKSREWDYILKFADAAESDTVHTCQYKIIFDKQFKAQEFYWQPSSCANYAKPSKQTAGKQMATYQTQLPVNAPIEPVAKPISTTALVVYSDMLFAFDKYALADMLPQGKARLDKVAYSLQQHRKQGAVRGVITGHSDNLGTADYNMSLSQRRADTVAQYLMTRGIQPSELLVGAVGAAEPVVQCDGKLPRPQLIDCLQPNRRVNILIEVYPADKHSNKHR